MGWLIPKTHLRWWEPRHCRRTREAMEERALPRYFRPAAASIFALLLLGGWALAHLNPKRHPPPWYFVLPFSFVFGAFIVYVLPLIYRLMPIEIRIRETDIFHGQGNVSRARPYREIQSCRVVVQGEGASAIAVLEIRTNKGGSVIYGIAPSVSLDELCRILGERGVAVARGPAPAARFPEASAETAPPG